MRGPHVRFCERREGAILRAYSTSVVHRSTGLDRAVAPDGHWGAVAEPLMKTMLVVEGEIFADPDFRLAAVGVALEIDVLILQRAPDAFDEDVVHPAAAPVHRDAHAGLNE